MIFTREVDIAIGTGLFVGAFIKIFEYVEKYIFTGNDGDLYYNIPQLSLLLIGVILLDVGLYVLISTKK